MATRIFVNLPVTDVQQSIAFFASLGYTFDPRFTTDAAAAMVVSDTIFVMLVGEPLFATFTPKPIADAAKFTEAIMGLSCDSRDDVNAIVAKAVAAGATTPVDAVDHGFMYEHGFQDLDGHLWSYFHIDVDAMPEA